ncbi:hypothetical protein D1871_02205 [Nakamurella silvestris]|nr:hypothetical protein D1871_02205 [Nakamurella silvestris]
MRSNDSEFDIPDDDELPVEYGFGVTFLDCGCPDQFFCPRVGEVECPRHSGFTRCCDRTTEHVRLKSQQELRQAVSTLWAEHEGSTFPTHLNGEVVVGIDVVELNADIASFVLGWEGCGTVSDGERQHRIRQLLHDSDAVMGALADAHEAEYFSRLRAHAKLMYTAGT